MDLMGNFSIYAFLLKSEMSEFLNFFLTFHIFSKKHKLKLRKWISTNFNNFKAICLKQRSYVIPDHKCLNCFQHSNIFGLNYYRNHKLQ